MQKSGGNMEREHRRIPFCRRALALILVFMLVLSISHIGSIKVSGGGEIKNVNLSEDGVLTWDNYAGAVKYDLCIISVGEVRDCKSGFEVFKWLREKRAVSKKYEVGLLAKDSTDIIAQKSFEIEYNSPDQLHTPQNLKWDGYNATWDAVSGASEYVVKLHDETGTAKVEVSTYSNLYDFESSGSLEGFTFTVVAIGEGHIDSNVSSVSPAWSEPGGIKEVELTVNPPMAGNTPKAPVVKTEKVSTVSYEWKYKEGESLILMPPDKTFDEGKEYTLQFQIKAAEGFVFKTPTSLTFNGAPVADWSYNSKKLITLNYTFTAAPKTYRVNISPSITYGKVTADKTDNINAGDNINLSVTPDEGYILESLTVKDESKATVAMETENSFKMPASNVDVEAVFKEKPHLKYNISFDTGGGSAIATHSVEQGSVVVKPADPVKNGYSFEGWYGEAEFINAFDFNMPVKADITIFAKWKKNPDKDSGIGESGSSGSGGGRSSGKGRSSGGGGSSSGKSSGGTSTKKNGEWQQDSVGWWYKNTDDSYPKGMWENIDGVWYAFNEAGYMITGWYTSGGQWYFLSASGAMSTGWIENNGKWYYLEITGREKKPQGAMYAGEKTPDGYNVNALGEWIK